MAIGWTLRDAILGHPAHVDNPAKPYSLRGPTAYLQARHGLPPELLQLPLSLQLPLEPLPPVQVKVFSAGARCVPADNTTMASSTCKTMLPIHTS